MLRTVNHSWEGETLPLDRCI